MTAETSHFFRPVGQFCQRPVLTEQASSPLSRVVDLMRASELSSVVVLDGDQPVGIITDRDLRDRVVATGITVAGLVAADVMHGPLITIDESAALYEALHQMQQLGIHRLGVVNRHGGLVGIVSQTDILRQQSHSPQELMLGISEAEGLDALRPLNQRIQALVVHLAGTGIRTRDLVRMIAHLNDRILTRVIELLMQERRHADLSGSFCFVVMGSEGRAEQTLWTDQDNAMVHGDDLSPGQIAALRVFARELIDALITIGVPACPGGIMASNEAWFGSLSNWKREVSGWAQAPGADSIMKASMFVDLRAVHGEAALADALRDHVFEELSGNRSFLIEMAQTSRAFKPPLGWFGKIKVDASGPDEGVIDVKKAGLFAITEAVKVLGLEDADLRGGTLERIQALLARGTLPAPLAEEVADGFEFLLRLRLHGQIEALQHGKTADNRVRLDELHRMDRARLRVALEGVGRLQAFVKQHFGIERID